MPSIVLKNSGPIVGLDIGSSYVKVCQAQLGRGQPEITALGIMPTPQDAVSGQEITDPTALGQALRSLLGEAGIKARKVVSAINGQNSVVVRIIELPKMTRNELRESMKWEVERHVPFAAGDVEMDFQELTPIEEVPDGSNMEVLLAVAQSDAVQRHLTALQTAGLQPQAIDVGPLAAERALLLLGNDTVDEGAVAVVNLGATVTEVNIYRNGRIAFTRAIQIAGATLTKAISDGLGQPLTQAERLKRELAAVPENAAVAGLGGAEDPLAGFGGLDFGAETGPIAGPEVSTLPGPPAAPPAPEPGVDIAAGGFGPAVFVETTEGPVFDTPAAPVPPAPGGSGPDPALAGPTPAADPFGGANPFDSPFDLPAAAPAPAPTPAAPSGDATASDEEYLRSQIADVLLPVLGELVTELRRSIDFFRNRAGGQGVQRMILCGGGALLPGLGPFLHRALDLPVEIGNAFQHVAKSVTYDSRYLDEVGPVFAVAVGLAVREMMFEPRPTKGRR